MVVAYSAAAQRCPTTVSAIAYSAQSWMEVLVVTVARIRLSSAVCDLAVIQRNRGVLQRTARAINDVYHTYKNLVVNTWKRLCNTTEVCKQMLDAE